MDFKKQAILVIIDGLGLRHESQGNAFALAATPTFDSLFKNSSYAIIQASGEAVGLPEGQMGNSEVGHLNIGAGEVVYTGLSLINQAIKKRQFANNKHFQAAFQAVEKNQSTLHIMGLLSPGGVHSHEEHLFELLEAAHTYGLKKVAVHVFGDGRDVAPRSIIYSLEKLLKICAKYAYQIATIAGRFYAMDRDKIFSRVDLAYKNLLAESEQTFASIIDYVEGEYNQGISDEFLIPAHFDKFSGIKDDDAIIFFNFRPDRARQLSHYFCPSKLYDLVPERQIKIAQFVSMMKYEGIPSRVAFEEMEIPNPLGKVLESANLKQLRVAETQKYAHVTYFMDGGVDINYKNSKRILIDSLKAESFADVPLMSAKEITDAVLENATNYSLTILNFANPDMVGHTGNLQATVQAVHFIDSQIKRLWDFANQEKMAIFITADHGNAEITEDKNEQPATKHTKNPVMLITNLPYELKNGKLANIAPTILDFLEIKKPQNMSEESLLKR